MSSYSVNTNSKTIISLSERKVIFFSFNDFYDDIICKDSCFICGYELNNENSTNEHIIPKWVIKRFDLYNKNITLPNGALQQYSKYTTPCCKDCNKELGEKVENPISKLLKNNYASLISKLKTSSSYYQDIFKWICLIFLKTHLKDRQYNQTLDFRKNDGKISDIYNWNFFHHVHCMSRVHHTNALVDTNVYGSLLILPVITYSEIESFDYIDNHSANTAMIQIGDFCIIAVLNDSCAVQSLFQSYIQKINGRLNRQQIIEIFVHFSYLNLNLKNRSIYKSTITNLEYKIIAEVPEIIELYEKEFEKVKIGDLMYNYLHKSIPENISNREELITELKEGKRQFLFDNEGNFLQNLYI